MWQPIIDPEARQPYWEAIEEIERALLASPLPDVSGALAEPETVNPTLGSGTSGRALFFAYLDAVRQDAGAGDHAVELLGHGIDALAQLTLGPSLYGGFCGVGWVVEHLTREFYEGDGDLTDDLHAALQGYLENAPERLHFELISGLSGFGLYLLERLPHPGAEALLARTLDHLERTAEESPDGLTWFTLNSWVPAWQRENLPDGCYNLGVAHGVPGVLGFLAAARSAGIADPRIPRLAEGTVRWLLRHRLPDGGDSVFPALAVPGQELEPTRTAWCYGDLGIAAVLLAAARAFDRPDWEEEALAAARLATRRPLQPVLAIDAGLCHGAAGLAHLFNRMYQTSGDPELAEAARDWYRRTLAMRSPGEGLAGYLAWSATTPDDRSWKSDPGFLLGVSGIGLALLAAVSEVDPGWDRILLASLPKPAEGRP
jgi:lantibiotic modifying enzyme